MLNIALDPLLIHGAFGIPGFGFNGIAVATAVIHGAVCLYMVYHALTSHVLRDQATTPPRTDFASWREMMRQGAPTSAKMLTVSFGISVIQSFLEGSGQKAVTAYGVGTRIEQLILLTGDPDTECAQARRQ